MKLDWSIKMKYLSIIVVIALLVLTGNTIGHREVDTSSVEEIKEYEEVSKDLDQIKRSGVLKAITTYSSTNYFLYKGKPMGYEYELLERLAEYLDLNLEVIITKDQESAYEMLHKGEGDLIAMGLTINASNKEKAAFTYPHRTTKQVLIQKKPWNWRKMKIHEIEETLVRAPFELIDKPVYVRENSAHYQRLLNLSEEIGEELNIVQIPGYMTTYEIMKKVNDGDYDYAVVDENNARINRAEFPDLDMKTAMSLPVRTGWAVRKSSEDLRRAINTWILKMRKDVDYYVIYNKYFKNKRFLNRRIQSELYSKTGGKISPFDSLIKANSNGYDWRFIASIMYQESQFEKDTNSWVGAVGLMQLMPSTAKSLGVEDPTDPEQNIAAGVKYLDYLYSFWDNVPDSVQRVKFALASYNCGLAHVLDAQRLAEKYDDDPERWDENVAEYILKLSDRKYFTDPVVKYGYCRGSEPYQYVIEIFKRYRHYQKFIPSKEETFLMASVEPFKPVPVFKNPN